MDKYPTLDPVMVSVVSSILTGGNFLLKMFKSLDANSGLKCKCDLVVKNLNVASLDLIIIMLTKIPFINDLTFLFA